MFSLQYNFCHLRIHDKEILECGFVRIYKSTTLYTFLHQRTLIHRCSTSQLVRSKNL